MPHQLPYNAQMSTQGPAGMGNPFVDFFKRLVNNPQDIQLPNESGQVDPRTMSTNPLQQLQKAFQATQDIGSANDVLKGLQQAGQRQIGQRQR